MQSSYSLARIAVGCALIFAGCDGAPSARRIGGGDVRDYPADRGNDRIGGGESRSAKARQLEFLNRIRQADPSHQTIERAVMNEQNELGVILSRSVEMDKIPALMRSLLTQMAKEFPGEDLKIIAYAPSNPPRTIGTARLNARTRDMTYTPAA